MVTDLSLIHILMCIRDRRKVSFCHAEGAVTVRGSRRAFDQIAGRISAKHTARDLDRRPVSYTHLRADNPHGAAQLPQPRGLGSLPLRGRARSLGASAQARVACSGSVPLSSGARYPQGALAQREHERARRRRT